MLNPPLLQRLRQAAAVLFPSKNGRASATPPVSVPARPAPEGDAQRRQRQELALVRVELATLLNAMPQSRTRYPQLAGVERAIGSEGMAAIHSLGVDILQPALLQLESVCSNWSQAGLANLRSKMAVSIIDHGDYESPRDRGAYRTAAVLEVSRQALRQSVELPPEPAPAPERSEEDALASAYANLGAYAPAAVTMQGELNSRSGRALAKPGRTRFDLLPELALRDVRDGPDPRAARETEKA
jgi:hypothetical protein